MVSSLDRSRAISLSLPEAVSLHMVKVPRIRFLFCRGSSVPSRCSVVLGSGSCACARTALASCSPSLHTECHSSVTSVFTHYPETAEKNTCPTHDTFSSAVRRLTRQSMPPQTHGSLFFFDPLANGLPITGLVPSKGSRPATWRRIDDLHNVVGGITLHAPGTAERAGHQA